MSSGCRPYQCVFPKSIYTYSAVSIHRLSTTYYRCLTPCYIDMMLLDRSNWTENTSVDMHVENVLRGQHASVEMLQCVMKIVPVVFRPRCRIYYVAEVYIVTLQTTAQSGPVILVIHYMLLRVCLFVYCVFKKMSNVL